MIVWWNQIKFLHPHALWLLLVPLLLLFILIWRYRYQYREWRMPFLGAFQKPIRSWKNYIIPLPYILRLVSLSALIVAFARPQSFLKEENITAEGIDIVISIDVSSSMLARDFTPDRLQAAKKVARDFIDGRSTDRIGLVVFAGESFTQCPITSDHTVLKTQLDNVKDGLIKDGTAIGMGLATAVSRLKESEAKSKVIILLTDGVNNMGLIDPSTAAEIAVQFGIRVYTIGVGTIGEAPYPFQQGNRVIFQNVPVEIDEELLQNISKLTEGLYFRATDNKSLQRIFEQIDSLEKSKIEVATLQRVSEEFYPFAWLALFTLSFELILRYWILKLNP